MAPYEGRTFYGTVSSEHGNTPSSSIKSGIFLEQLYPYQLLTKASALLCLFSESSEKPFIILPVCAKIVRYISNNNNNNNNNNNSNMTLRNYSKQPYWAMPTYFG